MVGATTEDKKVSGIAQKGLVNTYTTTGLIEVQCSPRRILSLEMDEVVFDKLEPIE